MGETGITTSGPKALADVVEALIAAVFLDTQGDVEKVYQLFLLKLMESVLGEEEESGDKNDELMDDDDAQPSSGAGKGERGKKNMFAVEDREALASFFPNLWGICIQTLPGMMEHVWDMMEEED